MRRDRRWVVGGLVVVAAIILIVGAWAENCVRMVGSPRTIVRLTSTALAFQPKATLDLVAAARPRFGLVDAQRSFDGIVLDSSARADEVLRDLGFQLKGKDSTSAKVIQSLRVTPGCVVGIEQVVGRTISLDIHGPADSSCSLGVNLLLDTLPNGRTRRFDSTTTLVPGHSASLHFTARDPLNFRRFHALSIGATTTESGAKESAIRGGSIRLPDFGDDSTAIYAGDDLELGELEGEIVELHVDTTAIQALFRGKASNPVLNGVDNLEPSLLQQGLHSKTLAVVLSLIIGTITLAMAVFQVVLRS